MYLSPLRYPGGKRRLSNFFKLLCRSNDLLDGDYAEAYAGGAAVALELVMEEYVARVHINDLDAGVHSFWWAVLNENDELCRRISSVSVTIGEWEKQKEVCQSDDPDMMDLAVATFFLNRSNRSGIITGGPIGGKKQEGKWTIEARFNKENLIKRIKKIGRYSSRIKLYNQDGLDFIKDMEESLPERSLLYLDPPYFVAGKQELYRNYYEEEDHAEVASLISSYNKPWIVTYDNVQPIRDHYNSFNSLIYGINYSAQTKYEGNEIIVFSDELSVPSVPNPSRLKKRDYLSLEKEIKQGENYQTEFS